MSYFKYNNILYLCDDILYQIFSHLDIQSIASFYKLSIDDNNIKFINFIENFIKSVDISKDELIFVMNNLNNKSLIIDYSDDDLW